MLKNTCSTTKIFFAGLIILGLAAQADATLLVRYTFDEASSGTTNALNVGGSLGSAADGVFTGNSTRTSNTPGSSLGAANLNPNGTTPLEGVGPTAEIASLDQLSTMTVSTWVNVQGERTGGYYSLVSDAYPGWLFYYAPDLGNDTQMKLGFQVNSSFKQTTSIVSANNTWVFVAATWDRISGDVKFYTGSVGATVTQVGSTLTGLTTVMGDNSTAMHVGNDTNDSTPIAFLDDVRVYDNVLSLGELNAVRLETAPEPSSASMALCALAGLYSARRRKLNRQ